jgi:hypothetical protein
MLDLVQQLIAAKQKVQEDPDATVTISLPLDDPRAQKLVGFARKLMIPTTKIRASGLTTQTGIDCSDNSLEFLEELRKTLGDELYEELMADMGGQIELNRAMRDEQATSDPGFLASAVHALGEQGALADMPKRETLVNMADELLRKAE